MVTASSIKQALTEAQKLCHIGYTEKTGFHIIYNIGLIVADYTFNIEGIFKLSNPEGLIKRWMQIK